MIELSESKVYEFDDFRLNSKSHRLFRCTTGELVPLTPKAIELLLVLIQNGAVLAQVKMQSDFVWAGTESEYLKALELDPNNAIVRQWYGEFFRIVWKNR
jgi:DNA-binding response OmpR family regulator